MLPEKKIIEHEMEKDYLGQKTYKQTVFKNTKDMVKKCGSP